MATKAKHLALSVGNNIDASGNVDSDTLDNLDSAQFLRSDTSDTMTGNLEINESSAYTGYEFLTLSRAEPSRYRSQIGFGDYGGSNRFGLSFTTRNNNVDYRTMTMVDGNVGIGTTTPTATLQAEGNQNSNPVARFKGTGSSDNPVLTIETHDNSRDPHLRFLRPNGTSGAAMVVRGGSGSDWLSIHHIARGADDQIVLKHDGNVGIGTNSPTKKLDIRGGDVTIHGGVDGYNADQERVRLYMGNNNAHIGAMYNYGLFFDPGNGAGDALMIRQSTGNVGVGKNNPSAKLDVSGDIGQSFDGDDFPSAVRKIYKGTIVNSGSVDLFTLNGSELPFAGTIYISAYKSSEGASGVWTAACIYPTVTPAVNRQSYVTRGNESINLTWSLSSYTPTLRADFGGFAGTTFYTILVDGIVQQNYNTAEGPL